MGIILKMDPLSCRSVLISEMTRRFCKNESIAEDAVDEAISRLLKIELKSENVFPILYQISKNVIFDRKKRSEVARRRSKILRNSTGRPLTPLQNSISNELENSLKHELESLNNQSRLAFEMFYLDGLSHREVALKIGITESYSKTLVFRARRILRNRLEKFAS